MASFYRSSAAAAVLLLLAGIARADTITVYPMDEEGKYGRGQYYLSAQDGLYYHDRTNHGYVAGNLGGDVFRNFFVFDLSAVTGTITSATLVLNAWVVSSDSVYSLYDVTTPVETLIADLPITGSNDSTVFDDLGGGTLYGSHGITVGDTYKDVSIPLTGAILALNAAVGGKFSAGGALSGPAYDQCVFKYSSGDDPNYSRLVLVTVPEPGTLTLMLAGAVSLMAVAWRRNAHRPM
jgi:hypothetical protein